MARQVLEVRRDDLRTSRIVTESPPALLSGEALLRVERFALTANNVTYARMGDALGYWTFFPPAEPGWGRIPVWGYADVVASAAPEVAVGRRLFGYVPMGTHLVIRPERVTPSGLIDGSSHRRPLPGAYNFYRNVDVDPSYDPDHEDELILLLPLFVLSFVLDLFLADNQQFKGETVIVSSASAKTSIGLAWLLAARGVDVTALTSARHADFVADLGVYRRVITYDHVTELALEPAVLADVAGNDLIRRAVHEHLGKALVHSTLIGATHWDTPISTEDMPGPTPTGFFAPDHLRHRMRSWGADEFDRRFGKALREFAAWTRRWLRLTQTTDWPTLQADYGGLLNGDADPAAGHIHIAT
jgi:NADPH:quinone reductase-like Zn-dependent oxidoreductase